MNSHTRYKLTLAELEAFNSAVAHRLAELTANFTSACWASVLSPERSVTEARAVIG
nr:Hha/YmoA family nucleoid-associated regulatory protein [Escherichia coli]